MKYYTIKKNKNTNLYEILSPFGVVANFEKLEDARQYLNSIQ